MKFKSLFSLLILFVSISIISCSSDDSDNSNSIEENSFTLTVDGEVINLTNTVGQISENTILVFGENDEGDFAQVLFHREGNLGNITVSVDSEPGQFGNSYSTAYFYSSNTMDFDVIEVNEENNTASAQFSGELFEDDIDLENSASTTVSGEFNVPLIQRSAEIPGLEFYAQINDEDWYSTSGVTTSGSNSDLVTEWNINDTQYGIGLRYAPGQIQVGTFNFEDSSSSNSMRFEDYSSIDDVFETEGVLEITEVNNGFSFQQVIGTFSFVATNTVTGEVVNITNGRVNTVIFN